MKRAACLAFVALLSLAQRSRDEYRDAYRAWRQADPDLEHDASKGSLPIAQRADRLAAEAAKSMSARKAYLESVTQDEEQQIAWLQNPVAVLDVPALSTAAASQFVTSESATVTRTMDTFANNPDGGIQQLRAALARERMALDALGIAVGQRKKTADTVVSSTATIEQTRAKALEQSRTMLQGLKEAGTECITEAAAWAEYYRKIGEAAQGEGKPITAVPAGVPTATLNNPVPAPPTVTPVPAARYIGAWSFPPARGMFHGPEPEFFDILVHQDTDHVKGTVFARFKLPSGSTGDPVLRFDFSGDFQTTRNQKFDLVTAEGVKGTIELIPGPAFNLLEVNFQTDANPGKIRVADVVLVKK